MGTPAWHGMPASACLPMQCRFRLACGHDRPAIAGSVSV